MRSQCIEACFWQNQYWAIGSIYEGPDQTPGSKGGRQFFVPLDNPPPEPVVDAGPPPRAATVAQREAIKAKWELTQMPKIEIQQILARRYGIKVLEEVTKKDLIEMVLEKQALFGKSNQEIANTVKR